MKRKIHTLTALLIGVVVLLGPIWTADHACASEASDLAQELTNPLADLMTIPIQMNFDRNIGVHDQGERIQTNIQPIIPIHLNDRWNLITRTIMPIIHQEDIYPGQGSQAGLGDITMTFFLSPKAPTTGGLVWGVGPVFIMPAATDSLLGSKKWSAGPSGAVLTMKGPWTLGALANHVWSFAGDSDRRNVNASLVQPFVSYTWSNAWSMSLQSESVYDWASEKWSVPVNLSVSKLVYLGKLPVSLQAGVGYWVETPDTGPEGWRFRLGVSFILPTLFGKE
nr:hypothetical protein [uncultured Desulfobacter sp.]